MEELIKAPKIIVPINATPATPEEAAKGEDTVTMVFDNDVLLTVDTNQRIHYPKGVHEVPRHLSNHWYLKAHGVRLYAKPYSAPAVSVEPSQPVTGLEALSREELLVMAKGYGLTVHPSTGSAKLIDKINAAKAATADPDSAPPVDGDDGEDSGASD